MFQVKNVEDEEQLHLGRNPDWMSGLPEELHDAPLWNLAIPGKTEKPGRSWVKLAIWGT